MQDLRACLAKAALKFLRALCEHFDNNQTCVSNSSNAFTLLATVLLKRASDGSAFLKQDALGSLRLLPRTNRFECVFENYTRAAVQRQSESATDDGFVFEHG